MNEKKLHCYMNIAFATAKISKDTTKVGALIVGPNEEVRSIGYNGFPRKVLELPERNITVEEKLFWAEHAERNAIYNAARVGTPLEGSMIFVTKFPCSDCCRAIIQSGIKTLVTFECRPTSKWFVHYSRVNSMLMEAGVNLILLNIKEFKNGDQGSC